MTKAYYNIIAPLVSYSCDVFTEVTPEKQSFIRLRYEIIREAIADMHGEDPVLKIDAARYFGGELFQKHCEEVGISPEVMTYIAHNPHKYLRSMVYQQAEGEYFESYC